MKKNNKKKNKKTSLCVAGTFFLLLGADKDSDLDFKTMIHRCV